MTYSSFYKEYFENAEDKKDKKDKEGKEDKKGKEDEESKKEMIALQTGPKMHSANASLQLSDVSVNVILPNFVLGIFNNKDIENLASAGLLNDDNRDFTRDSIYSFMIKRPFLIEIPRYRLRDSTSRLETPFKVTWIGFFGYGRYHGDDSMIALMELRNPMGIKDCPWNRLYAEVMKPELKGSDLLDKITDKDLEHALPFAYDKFSYLLQADALKRKSDMFRYTFRSILNKGNRG